MDQQQFTEQDKKFIEEIWGSMKELEEERDLQINKGKASAFLNVALFVHKMCDDSFGDLTEVDYEPGSVCSVSAVFDTAEISGELLPWFQGVLGTIDGLAVRNIPDDEGEIVVELTFEVKDVWEGFDE